MTVYNTPVITSTRNPKIQDIRALQSRAKRRREAGAFIIEGIRLAEEALAVGWQVQLALYTGDLPERGQRILRRLRDAKVPLEEVSADVMAAASDTPTPQGLLLQLPAGTLELELKLDLVLVLDAIQDPGNLGTLLRSAVAAGAGAALLGPGCADAFSPKVLRAAMGAHFTMPILEWNWGQIGDLLSQRELPLYLAEVSAGQRYDLVDMTQPIALLVGNEAHGPGDEARLLAHDGVHIPIPGDAESLNAAVAGSVLLFEAARQRRAKAGA